MEAVRTELERPVRMSSPHYPHFGEDFRAPPGVRRGHISLEYSDGSVSSPDSTKHSPSRVAAKLSAGRVFTLYHHATGVREVYGSVAEFTDAVRLLARGRSLRASLACNGC